MCTAGLYCRRAGPRDRLYFGRPDLWPLWPFLPLLRLSVEAEPELGVLYDARGVTRTTGFACTVFLTNLLGLPPTEDGLLALPRLVYDTLCGQIGYVVTM